MRIGIGFDTHAFAPGRRLILGGVEIPHTRGLLGHSDADALLHAIADAILGALGRDDIGHLFPDTDPAWKDLDSARILERAAALMIEDRYRIANVDAVILAQEPKLAPHMPAMKERIAAILAVPATRVGIKATTTERLGFTGRGEGLSTMAVVLLEESGAS